MAAPSWIWVSGSYQDLNGEGVNISICRWHCSVSPSEGTEDPPHLKCRVRMGDA